jgi:hypothetical protein
MDMSLILLLTMGFLASALMIGLSQAVTVLASRRCIRK